MQAAIAENDIERQLTFMHPDVVVTWHNAEVSRRREGVREYLQRMLEGPDKVVAHYGADLTVDELSILHGDRTAISWGSALEHFELSNGTRFDLPARWSATLVKEDGQWLIASLHASDNLFDNPMLAAVKRIAFWAGGICSVAGLLVGFFVARGMKRVA